MIFDAIPLKALSVDSLTDHIGSFVYEVGDKTLEVLVKLPWDIRSKKFDDILQAYPKAEMLENDNYVFKAIVAKRDRYFSYDTDSSVPLKAQYREYFAANVQVPIGLCFSESYSRIFHLTDQEIHALNIIMFDRSVPLPVATYPGRLFRTYEKTAHSSDRISLARDRLNIIKPADIRELNFGPISSPLSEKAKAFMKGLEKGKFPPIFIKNVTSYLQSFNLIPFQEQAVKIMTASLQSKEVIIDQGGGPTESDKEEEIPDLGDF